VWLIGVVTAGKCRVCVFCRLHLLSISVDLGGHGFTTSCSSCSSVPCFAPDAVAASRLFFDVPISNGSSITLGFGAALDIADQSASALRSLNGEQLIVSGVPGITSFNATAGAYATDANGNLKALLLGRTGGAGVFFSACGPLVIQNGATIISFQTTGLGAVSSASSTMATPSAATSASTPSSIASSAGAAETTGLGAVSSASSTMATPSAATSASTLASSAGAAATSESAATNTATNTAAATALIAGVAGCAVLLAARM
jgi:hypothetical protein